MERIEKVRTYVLTINAAAGTSNMRARRLAQRLAAELGYQDPLSVQPFVALEPALVEIEQALDGAPVAEAGDDTWG